MHEESAAQRHEGQDKFWLIFGDLHDLTGNIHKIPDIEKAEGLIISGDLTQLGGVAEAEKVLAVLDSLGKPVFAQTGNMDKPEVDAWLSGKGINIHDRVLEISPGVAIFGIGGSTPTPFGTPTEYPESAYAAWLDECWKKASRYPAQILVSHNPPKDTKCDRIASGAHVGSEAVRKFIDACQPTVCICGHIHEARATERLGKTVVINPGMLSEGGYARVAIRDNQPDAHLCDLNAKTCE